MLPVGAPGMFNPMMTGQYPMAVPPGWPMPGIDGGVGPIRNGMRGPNMRGSAPYDRGGRRGNNGRSSPPRVGPGGVPGRGRPNFTEGGIGTFSGSQAVDGRTVKSYTDLDAAGGGGAGNGSGGGDAGGGGGLDY